MCFRACLSKGYLIKSQNKNNSLRLITRDIIILGMYVKIFQELMFILGRNDKQIKLKGLELIY